MELFDTYSEFLALRESLIAYAIKGATYAEDRDGEKVRPLMVIRTEAELRKVNSMIAKWLLLADQLCEGDPVRYNRASVIFSPEPKVLYDQAEIFIKVNVATSTRKITREKILKRLTDLRRVSYLAQGNSIQTKRYAREITFFNKETEEEYRIRSEGYTEIVLLHRKADEDELSKMRVPFAGIFVFDPDKKCRIYMPEHGREYIRSDKLANMGIKPIPCSLNIRGVLLRESDIIKAKGKNAAERVAAHKAKTEAAKIKRQQEEDAAKKEKAERAEQRAIERKERQAKRARERAERVRLAAEKAAVATAKAAADRLEQEAEKLKRAKIRKEETARKKAEKAAKLKAERAEARAAKKAERDRLKAEAAEAKRAERERIRLAEIEVRLKGIREGALK